MPTRGGNLAVGGLAEDGSDHLQREGEDEGEEERLHGMGRRRRPAQEEERETTEGGGRRRRRVGSDENDDDLAETDDEETISALRLCRRIMDEDLPEISQLLDSVQGGDHDNNVGVTELARLLKQIKSRADQAYRDLKPKKTPRGKNTQAQNNLNHAVRSEIAVLRSALLELHNVTEIPRMPQLRGQYPTLYSNAIASLLEVVTSQHQAGGDDGAPRRQQSTIQELQLFVHTQLTKALRTARYELKNKRVATGGGRRSPLSNAGATYEGQGETTLPSSRSNSSSLSKQPRRRTTTGGASPWTRGANGSQQGSSRLQQRTPTLSRGVTPPTLGLSSSPSASSSPGITGDGVGGKKRATTGGSSSRPTQMSTAKFGDHPSSDETESDNYASKRKRGRRLEEEDCQSSAGAFFSRAPSSQQSRSESAPSRGTLLSSTRSLQQRKVVLPEGNQMRKQMKEARRQQPQQSASTSATLLLTEEEEKRSVRRRSKRDKKKNSRYYDNSESSS